MKNGLRIRLACPDDLPAIVEIYNQAIPSHCSTADLSPVTVEARRPWFREHEPDKHPIYVAEMDGKLAGWCSLSAYRPGRMALRYTAEISYYVDPACQRQGIGSALVREALEACPGLGIRNVFAVLLDRNEASRRLLEKLGFTQWGYLPRVADFDGQECGQFYYGLRIPAQPPEG
jgi:L-amino acid N-acyltransferase YncA